MSLATGRPKRAAEEYVRTHRDDFEEGGPSKKPRFDVRNPSALAPDALEEDATLDADVIGSRGQQVRRKAVNIDGYDSDSDNGGFDARANAKARENATNSGDEEGDNMFTNLKKDFMYGDESNGDEEFNGDEERKMDKKKAVKFLKADEIEGQIHSSKSGGHVSADFSLKSKWKATGNDDRESSSESEADDETRADIGDIDEELGAGGKKKHAPKLDAFNMREENEEGRFDDQGNYVRKAADPDAIHDTWLKGLSKRDIRSAKEAVDKRDEERRKRDIEDDAILTGDVLKTLILRLERGETALEALARLGKGRYKKPKWQTRHKNRKKQELVDVDMTEEDPAEVRRKAAVEEITGAADLLLTRGQPEIYEEERELLIRQYQRETGEEWTEPSDQGVEENGEWQHGATKMWEYRWSDARDGGLVHGPYEGSVMVQWNEAGYFQDGVEFRRAPGGGEWSRVVDFT